MLIKDVLDVVLRVQAKGWIELLVDEASLGVLYGCHCFLWDSFELKYNFCVGKIVRYCCVVSGRDCVLRSSNSVRSREKKRKWKLINTFLYSLRWTTNLSEPESILTVMYLFFHFLRISDVNFFFFSFKKQSWDQSLSFSLLALTHFLNRFSHRAPRTGLPHVSVS